MKEHDDSSRIAGARYEEMLAGEHRSSTLDALEAARAGGRLLHWERFGGLFLRPLFISEATHARARRAAVVVGRAVMIAVRRAMVDEVFRRGLRLPPEREYAVSLDRHLRPEPVVGRLDGFIDPAGQPRFLEYNAFPAGISETDRFNAVFDELPVMRALRREHPLRGVATLAAHAEATRVALARIGFQGVPTVGVIEAESRCPAASRSEPVQDFAAAAAGRSIRVVVGPPERFEYRGGRLLLDGVPVDFVTASDFDEFTRMLRERHPALAAFSAGAARFVDGLSTSFLALSKVLFAALSDPEHEAMFDREMASELRRLVPWTRMVRDGETTRDGVRVELLPYLAAQREEMVLKPASGHGGAGVTLGWQTPQARWEQLLAEALVEPWVAQERVRPPRERLPIVTGDEIGFVEPPWDLCPFVWNGDWSEGALVRVSRTEILNVGAGAAVDFPWFVVGER